MSGRSNLVDLDVVLRCETDKAWGFDDPNRVGKVIWVPKSQGQVEEEPAPSKKAALTCPEWLAKEKGLI